MNYISIVFLFFVMVIIVIYYNIPYGSRWKLLLFASICFYLSFEFIYLIFLLSVAVSTYICAGLITKKRQKQYLYGCVVFNIFIWASIKVAPWGFSSLLIIFKMGDSAQLLLDNIIAPIGISYYTLQALGYLLDVYFGNVKPEKSFWKYLLFLSYFPAIVQGPISRYSTLSNEFYKRKDFDVEQTRKYLFIILIGITKKIVIADQIAIFANYCFICYENYYGLILYLGAVSYAIQLYMDFSGCVDLCRGVSGLFGIELINNFEVPYLSKSIKEFWKRWHISLSNWLRDYIYIPLGGNRKGKLYKYCNLIITFVLSGIWHGAGLNFIVWGLIHAVYQIIGETTESLRNTLKKYIKLKENCLSDNFYRIIITFNLVTFAWIFFRAATISDAIGYIKNMFIFDHLWLIFDGTIVDIGIDYFLLFIIGLNILLVSIYEGLYYKRKFNLIETVLSSHFIIRWLIYVVLLFNIIFFGAYGDGFINNAFLYGGF